MSPVYLVSAKQKMRQHLPPRECETVNCFSSAGQQVESLFGRGTRRFLVGENDCLNSVKSEFVEKRRNQNDFARGRQKCRPTRTLPRRGTNVAHLRQPLCELDPCRDLALYRCGLRLLSTSRPARPVVAKSVRLSAILPHSGATSRCGSARRLRCHAASVLLFAHCDQHECTCGNSALIDARIKREKNRCSVLTHGSNVCKTNVVEAMKMTLTDMFTTWVRKRSAAF